MHYATIALCTVGIGLTLTLGVIEYTRLPEVEQHAKIMNYG